MSMGGLEMWVIYSNPRDYPGKFVTRRRVVTAASDVADAKPRAVEETLEDARAAVPWGCVCIGRQEGDDPVIVEVWL
jgi:hypothetical protein